MHSYVRLSVSLCVPTLLYNLDSADIGERGWRLDSRRAHALGTSCTGPRLPDT